MAHIKIKYVEPMCTLYREARWYCLNDWEEDGDGIKCCPDGELEPTRPDRCKYASIKEIQKEGNFKSWTLEKDGENVISLMLGKTYIEGDNISYLEIDGQVLVKEIIDDD